jgi:hypothetical protein
VLIGCAFANKVPGRKLRPAIALIAIALGLQLVYTGGRGILQEHRRSVENITQRAVTARGTSR